MTSFRKVLTAGVIVLGTMVTLNTFAQETTGDPAPTAPTTSGKHHHHHHGKFFLGICVGQKLAKQNVFLQPGKHDPTVKTQIEAAKAECKAAFKAAHTPLRDHKLTCKPHTLGPPSCILLGR